MRLSTERRIVIAALSLSLGLGGCDQKPPPLPAAPPKVTVSRPEMRELTDHDKYNGWLAAVESVDVRARVRGHIAKIHFKDGQLVEKDSPLFTLDERPFQAEADRAREQLRVYQAQKVAADKELLRLKDLLGKGGASQSQVDKAEADAGSLDAQIEAAKQEIKRKELDLEYARIAAPIAGRTSRALLTVGNFVNAGGSDPVLTTIVAVDPIYFYFNVDERALQRYLKARAETDPETRQKLLRELKVPVVFGLEIEEGYPHKGVLDFAENRIDQESGTIQVRGEAPNPDGQFIPGSRMRIRVPVSAPYKALLAPDTALLSDQDKKYLLVLGDQNVVLRRDVAPGKLLDDGMRVILPGRKEGEGLKETDRIIVLGLQRARVNYPVEPVDASGKPVDASGKAVDVSGKAVDDSGKPVHASDKRAGASGKPVPASGKPAPPSGNHD